MADYTIELWGWRRMQLVLRVMLFIGISWVTPMAAAETSLRVLSSIKPLQLIAIAVGGDAIHADVLLDPQFSPHDYQLRPSDRAKLEGAQIVFWVGPKLEAFLQQPLKTLSGRATVVSLQDSDDDPHIWMDPIATIQIAQRMAQVLIALYPERRAYFEANVSGLAKALTRQDAEYRAQLQRVAVLRGFMVSHDAYSRFERRYGLAHRAALTNAADMPPSAKSLLNIERELADGSIACVWRQPQESRLYQRVVAEKGIRTATLDAMAAQIPADADGVTHFYRQLWGAAISCLAG